MLSATRPRQLGRRDDRGTRGLAARCRRGKLGRRSLGDAGGARCRRERLSGARGISHGARGDHRWAQPRRLRRGAQELFDVFTAGVDARRNRAAGSGKSAVEEALEGIQMGHSRLERHQRALYPCASAARGAPLHMYGCNTSASSPITWCVLMAPQAAPTGRRRPLALRTEAKRGCGRSQSWQPRRCTSRHRCRPRRASPQRSEAGRSAAARALRTWPRSLRSSRLHASPAAPSSAALAAPCVTSMPGAVSAAADVHGTLHFAGHEAPAAPSPLRPSRPPRTSTVTPAPADDVLAGRAARRSTSTCSPCRTR